MARKVVKKDAITKRFEELIRLSRYDQGRLCDTFLCQVSGTVRIPVRGFAKIGIRELWNMEMHGVRLTRGFGLI